MQVICICVKLSLMNNSCPKHLKESKSQLKENGLKVTAARLGLLDVFKHTQKPLTIREISERLQKQEVDQVTLYRNVESLEHLGLVKKISLRDRGAYYELKTANHHHHLVCEVCGKMSDISGCKVTITGPKLLKNTGFAKISDHSLEFFGLCQACAKKA